MKNNIIYFHPRGEAAAANSPPNRLRDHRGNFHHKDTENTKLGRRWGMAGIADCRFGRGPKVVAVTARHRFVLVLVVVLVLE
jgi:hypothetical protein